MKKKILIASLFATILIFIPITSSVDINSDVNDESICKSEIGISDDNEEIISWIIGQGYFNWIKRRGIFRGEVEIKRKPWGVNNILLFGLRRAKGRIGIYSKFNPYKIHAYRFIGLETPFILGIALGNIEWS